MNVWEEVKNNLNIVDVISEYLPVKASGSNYKCLCPFHNDRNPSLVISPEKNIWHCFGCGAGGDVFRFVTDYENISKKDALEKLAKKAGVRLDSFEHNQKTLGSKTLEAKKIKRLEAGYKYLTWSKNVFHKVLLKILQDNEHEVTKYCRSRNLSQKIIEKFQLGYAPKNNFLLEVAKNNSLDLDLLVEIGVLKLEINNYKDKFTNRLVVPIFDQFNKVVGFTARNLPSDKLDRPKYLNSPETKWFNKSDIWYGQNWNQQQIKNQKKAIIVEGNMDVIAASISGLDIVLASQGTSFTASQLKKLSYLSKEIILAYDNDIAGLISAKKFFLEAKLIGLEVKKFIIPKEFKDLDEYLQQIRKTKEKVFISDFKIVNFIDYWINDNLTKLKSSEIDIQKKLILEVLELVAVCDQIEIEHYLSRLSEITNKTVQTLNKQLQKIQTNQSKYTKINFGFNSFKKNSRLVNTDEIKNSVRINLQKLISNGLAKSNFQILEMENIEKLRVIYKLINSLYLLFPEETLDEYALFDYKRLELISQELKNQEEAINIEMILINLIDRRNEDILLEPNLKSDYIWLKSSI